MGWIYKGNEIKNDIQVFSVVLCIYETAMRDHPFYISRCYWLGLMAKYIKL